MEDRRQKAAWTLAGHGVPVRDIVDIVNSASEDALDVILGKTPDEYLVFHPDSIEVCASEFTGKDRRQFWQVYAGTYRAGDPPYALTERARRVVYADVFKLVAKMGTWELEKAS
jgi:hypothetical protein